MKLRKIGSLIGIISLTIGLALNASAQKKSATKTSGGGGSYAMFNLIPYDGIVPTAADFGLKGNVKKVAERSDNLFPGYINYNLQFDPQGRLVLKENFDADDDTYSPQRYEFTYSEDGRLASIVYTYQAITNTPPTALVKATYDYNWDGSKLSGITETLSIDNGLNYQGKPTHLNLSYDGNGRLASANCSEVSRVKITFNPDGTIASQSRSDCEYETKTTSRGEKVDDLFTLVNLTDKRPLKWFSAYYPVEFADSYDYQGPRTIKGVNKLSSSATFETDAKGNWTKAVSQDSGLEEVFIREIEYY